MPTVKDFGAFKVVMYFEDHNPPHFHVIGPAFAAKVAIADLSVIAGDLPRSAKQALTWAAENEASLRRRWKDYSEVE